MSYKGTTKKIPEIGHELSVGSIVEGSVRQAGNRVRITAQLIHADNQAHLWSEDYDRDLTDIFAVQGDIAQRVTNALRVKLAAAETLQVTERSTRDLDAYNLYLKGRYHLNKLTEADIRKSIEYYGQAIERDPGFASAYSALADSYIWLPWIADIPVKEVSSKAKAAVAKALELNGTLAEAHSFAGGIKAWFEWDWPGAES